MKKIILISCVVCLSCCQSATDKINERSNITSKGEINSQVSTDLVDTPSDAKMDFNHVVWDFGEINEGDVLDYSFEFINSGSDPLIISNAKGSCGCTVPDWPRTPIPSGEKGVIDVKFNSKGKKGLQNKRVTLTTNVVPSQQILTVKGMVNLKEE